MLATSGCRRGHDPWRGIETRSGPVWSARPSEVEEVMIPGEGLKRGAGGYRRRARRARRRGHDPWRGIETENSNPAPRPASGGRRGHDPWRGIETEGENRRTGDPHRVEEVMIPGEGLKLGEEDRVGDQQLGRRGHDPWRGIETVSLESASWRRSPVEEVMIPGEGLKLVHGGRVGCLSLSRRGHDPWRGIETCLNKVDPDWDS